MTADDAAAVEVTATSLVGWVLLTRGLPAEGRQVFDAALRAARRGGDDFYVSSELSHVALAAALDGSEDGDDVAAEAVETARRVGATRQRAQADVAAVLAGAARVDPEESIHRLGTTIAMLTQSGDALEVRLPLLAMTIVSARHGRADLAEGAASRLDAFARAHRAHHALSRAAAWSAGVDPRSHWDVRWGEEETVVRERWAVLGRGGR